MLRFDEFELDEENALLTRAGSPVQLPPKAFALLCTLANSAGKLTRKDALLDSVWGHRHVSESVLKTTVSQLRAALSDDASKPRYIETASRLGYRFIGRVQSGGSTGAAPPASEIVVPQGGSGEHLAARATPEDDVPPAALAPLIGRKNALARMHQAWRSAQTGKRELFLVAGDPGVGKTRLVETFVSEVRPAVVAYGQCVEQFGPGEPYLPVLEAVGSLCRRFPEMPPMLRSIAPTWLLQLPWLCSESERATLSRELAGTHQERMVRELTELIARFTEKHPLLFITEDLHWADLATLRLMARFPRVHTPTRVLWLGSFRLTQVVAEDHPLQAIRQELRLHKLCNEVALEPFSESEVGEYLQSRTAQAQVPEAFVRRLHAHTDGLPLFVANVVDALVSQQDDRSPADAAWLKASANSALPVPDNLTGAIEKQIGRLSPQTRALLSAASVCGMEFHARTLADVLGEDLAAVVERCDELVKHQYWLRHVAILELPDGSFDTRYVFAHALYKHVFYQGIGAAHRTQHHRAVARSLLESRKAGIAVTAAELAAHHELGHETLAALHAYAEAAISTLNAFAPSEAVDLTDHALTLLPRCPEGPARLAAELALRTHRGVALTVLHGAGSQEARTALAHVRDLCDRMPPSPALAMALNGLGWAHVGRAEFDEAVAIARRLEAMLAAEPNPVLVVVVSNLLGLCLGVRGEHDEACAWLERGIAASSTLPQKVPTGSFIFDPEVSMRLHLAVPLLLRGKSEQALAQLAAATQIAESSGHPMSRMLTHWIGGLIDLRLGNLERIAERAQAMERLYATTLMPQAEGPSLWLRGLVEMHRGDAQRAFDLIARGIASRERYGLIAGLLEVRGYAVAALTAGGRWAEARALIDETMKLARLRAETIAFPSLLVLQARIATAQGERDSARAALREALQLARKQRAIALQIDVLCELIALGEEPGEDRAALAAAYAGITEGFDTPSCRRARQLL